MPSLKGAGINLVIIGALTGTRKDMLGYRERYPDLTPMPCGKKWSLQPPVDWVREVVEAADDVGVKVFLKDNLKPSLIECWNDKRLITDWTHGESEFEGIVDVKLRQEVPR